MSELPQRQADKSKGDEIRDLNWPDGGNSMTVNENDDSTNGRMNVKAGVNDDVLDGCRLTEP